MQRRIEDFEKKIFPLLRKRQVEMSYIPPQMLGPLTPYYHRVIPILKVAPWRAIFIGSVAATMLLRLLLGIHFVQLASLLQRGF